MVRSKNKFKNGLIGFDKIQVENYIDCLERNHNEKINEKLNIIKELEKSNSDLKEKINNLKNEINSKNQLSEEMITFATKKAEEWADELLQISSKKVEKFKQFARDEEMLMNKKIEAYNKLLKNSKEKLNLLLNEAIQRNNELIEEINKSIDKENKTINNGKEFISDNIIHYHNIVEERNSRKDNDEKTEKVNNLSNEEEKDNLNIDTQKVVNETGLNFQVNKDVMDKPIDEVNKCKSNLPIVEEEPEKVIEKDIIEEDEPVIINNNVEGDKFVAASDPEADELISILDEDIKSLKKFDKLEEDVANVTSEEKSILMENQDLNEDVMESSFWGENFNDTLFDTSNIEKSYKGEVVGDFGEVDDNYDIASDFNTEETKTEKETKSEIINNNFQEKNKKLEKEDEAVEKKDLSSRAINGEIQNIRIKYIAGKIAGEDLFGTNGTLLIRKGDKITIENIELAEKHGQLANLIMDMKLPEGN